MSCREDAWRDKEMTGCRYVRKHPHEVWDLLEIPWQKEGSELERVRQGVVIVESGDG